MITKLFFFIFLLFLPSPNNFESVVRINNSKGLPHVACLGDCNLEHGHHSSPSQSNTVIDSAKAIALLHNKHAKTKEMKGHCQI